MRTKEKNILLSYLYNNYVLLEDEMKNHQSNLRFRSIDSVDCVELICAIERFHLFVEVSRDIRTILRLYGDKDELQNEDEKCKRGAQRGDSPEGALCAASERPEN